MHFEYLFSIITLCACARVLIRHSNCFFFASSHSPHRWNEIDDNLTAKGPFHAQFKGRKYFPLSRLGFHADSNLFFLDPILADAVHSTIQCRYSNDCVSYYYIDCITTFCMEESTFIWFLLCVTVTQFYVQNVIATASCRRTTYTVRNFHFTFPRICFCMHLHIVQKYRLTDELCPYSSFSH